MQLQRNPNTEKVGDNLFDVYTLREESGTIVYHEDPGFFNAVLDAPAFEETVARLSVHATTIRQNVHGHYLAVAMLHQLNGVGEILPI